MGSASTTITSGDARVVSADSTEEIAGAAEVLATRLGAVVLGAFAADGGRWPGRGKVAPRGATTARAGTCRGSQHSLGDWRRFGLINLLDFGSRKCS